MHLTLIITITFDVGLEPGTEGPGSLDLRASAIAAVDAAENNIKTKNQRTDVPPPRAVPGVVSVGVAASAAAAVDTELSAELSNFPDVAAAVKLVTLQVPQSSSPSNLSLHSSGTVLSLLSISLV